VLSFHERLSELPALAGDAELALRVNGPCMLPLLEPGKRVRVKRARIYWPGDVLAVIDPAACDIKLHRCVGYVRRGGTWCALTQSDASTTVDRPTPFALVLGRLIGGECDTRAASIPWPTRMAATRVFLARVATKLSRWFRDPARLLSNRLRRSA
jgi:hypothetical protein